MITRGLTRELVAALADTPVVFVNGPRQAGKTTLVRSVETPEREYLSLDDFDVLTAARADPAGFVRGLRRPVIVDEVQRAPDLFLPLKSSVDRDRRPGRFLLTGSANVLLLPRLADSLAGRVEILTLWPLSQGEIEGRRETFVDDVFGVDVPRLRRAPKSALELPDRIVRGGFPEVCSRVSAERRAAWFDAYFTTMLERDVRDLADVEGLTGFPLLARLLAARVSALLNLSDLSRGVSIPHTTLKRYMALLEATFLLNLVPSWRTNYGLRLTKAPKVFLSDTGLAAHLLGADAKRVRSDGALMGPLLENFVAMELRKQAGWSTTRPRLYHFRIPKGREVDFVLEDRAGRVVGIEVKATASPGADAFNGLKTLREAAGDQFVRGVLLYGGDHVLPFGENLQAMPVRALWDMGGSERPVDEGG